MEFNSLADDFFVNLNVQTTLQMPNARETVLHFFEAVQKQFPGMASFFQRENCEFVLEGDRDSGSYSWAELHPSRFSTGYFNPPVLVEAYDFHRWLLERSVYYLGLSGLDIEAIDLLFGFNLDYAGNRDNVVAEALLGDSPLGGILQDDLKPLQFEPNLVVALDEDCYLQGRLSLETRCTSYQVRTGEYDNEPISIYFTVRQYPRPDGVIKPLESFNRLAELCEDICGRLIVPQIIQPIAETIATR
jgi:hypothetical protein